MVGAHGFVRALRDQHPGRRQRAHTAQSLTEISTRGVISVPLSHYRDLPPPIATPQQCRPSTPSARPSIPLGCPPIPMLVRPSPLAARPSPCLSLHPPVCPSIPLSVHPPVCPSIPGARRARGGGACAGGGAAPPGRDAGPGDPRDTPVTRPHGGTGSPQRFGAGGAGAGCCVCSGAGEAARVTAGLPQARAPGHLPVGEDALPTRSCVPPEETGWSDPPAHSPAPAEREAKR